MAIRDGSQLSADAQANLIVLVTEAEVLDALKGLGEDKAPGIYGYNSCFFKATWGIIREDVMAALEEFFLYGKLCPAVNCALVTFIPKFADAKSMKDMRPIACCTTLYKIISKVLTARLSRVINMVVDNSQSAFIPGKVIQDNILIANELLRGYGRKHLSSRCAIQMDLQKAYDTVEWKHWRRLCRTELP